MATIVLTWELGGGLGHLINLQPLAEGLAQRGHRVVAILRDLSGVPLMMPIEGVEYLQAPVPSSAPQPTDQIYTFAQILLQCGFADARQLAVRTDAWRNLFRYLKPDLIVFDHSPTALLASRGIPTRRAHIGTAFFCPLDVSPLPNFRPGTQPDLARLITDESQLRDNMNRVLQAARAELLFRVSQLYYPVDEHFLLTFPELETYPGRVGAKYWGMWSGRQHGLPPQWPTGNGPRIFAYLKPFAALPFLLERLVELAHPTIIYINNIDPDLRNRFRSRTLAFAEQPVHIAEVAAQCDLAILNGTLGTSIAMLLAGKPTLQIPISLEQGLAAVAIGSTGAAAVAPLNDPARVIGQLSELLASPTHAAAARGFAARYAGFDPVQQMRAAVDRAEQLAINSK